MKILRTHTPMSAAITAAIFISFFTPCFALRSEPNVQQHSDSIPTETDLEEIVIIGAQSYAIKDGIAYEPDKQAKKFSYSATSLLQRMAIPSLKTDGASGEIKTLNNENLSYFIDAVPASTEECRNLDPTSVIRVEVLQNPSDPRFQGARNVVNFIMRKYEYGGYAKANVEQGFWRNTGDYSLYDKTTYKDMTYQAIGGYSYSSLHDGGVKESESIYRFPSEIINVSTNSELPLNTTRNYFASFKAHYKNNRNFHVINTIGISGSPSPTNTITSLYKYNPEIFEDSETSVSKKLRSTSGFWESIIFIPVSKGVSLQFVPGVSYAYNRHDQAFRSAEEVISYKINEHVWNARMAAWLFISKGSNDFDISLGGNYINDNMNYLSQEDQNVRHRNAALDFSFTGSHKIHKVSINYNLAGKISFENSNDLHHTYFNPNMSLSASYSPARDHSLRLWTSWCTYPNYLADLNTASFQTSLLDVITGNPGLKPTKVYMASLRYNWMGTSAFSLAASIGLHYRHRPVTPDYVPEQIGGAPMMVRRFVNIGNFMMLYGNIGATLRLFDNSLICNGNLSLNSYHSKGFSLIEALSAPVNFNVQYYIRHFQFGLGMETPQWYVNPGSKGKNMWYYAITAGYSIKSLNISLKAANFFNNSYSGFRNEIVNPAYNCIETEWSSVRHRHITISLSYVFRYGKQTDGASNINVNPNIQSGILTK